MTAEAQTRDTATRPSGSKAVARRSNVSEARLSPNDLALARAIQELHGAEIPLSPAQTSEQAHELALEGERRESRKQEAADALLSQQSDERYRLYAQAMTLFGSMLAVAVAVATAAALQVSGVVARVTVTDVLVGIAAAGGVGASAIGWTRFRQRTNAKSGKAATAARSENEA